MAGNGVGGVDGAGGVVMGDGVEAVRAGSGSGPFGAREG